MEKTMSAIRGLHDMQVAQRLAANALLGIDYYMLCHDHYWVDCRRCAYLWEVRRSALWALDAQHSSMRATQQTQKALEDCAVHVSSYLLIGEASGKHRSCVCEQFNCLSCE